ncbi:MAG: response regulator transcription factor [Bacillota bacterium]|nr:response regulator transcription factor [Bacillota bacterium]
MAIRLIMVDDHPLVRKGIEAATRLEDDIELLGCSSNTEEALQLIAEHKPDVALVDLRLHDEHGLGVVRRGREICAHTRYIILTSYATEEEIRGALEEEVEGYVLKEALPEELISAIHTVGNGRKFFDPAVVQLAMNHGRLNKKPDLAELTPRELEVLKALGRGLNNRLIADELFISEHTVKKHVGAILNKLSLEDRTQAALFAVSRGLHRDS